MPPVLYKMDTSPPANAVRILADLIGLELEFKDIDFLKMEHKSPAYMKLNPMGTVPTLQDGDFVISESHTIMKYLLSKYGNKEDKALYPSEARARALVDQCLFFDTGVFFIRVKDVALPSVFSNLDEPSVKHQTNIDETYAVVEAFLADHKYIAADYLTLADISVGMTAAALQHIHKLNPTRFPRTADWLSMLQEQPSFKKIMIPGVTLLGQVLEQCWENNKKKNEYL